jgi:aryl-alcohol dehydrogenase-like predicted oxidoreductase
MDTRILAHRGPIVSALGLGCMTGTRTIHLTPQQLTQLEATVSKGAVAGPRAMAGLRR